MEIAELNTFITHKILKSVSVRQTLKGYKDCNESSLTTGDLKRSKCI